MLDLSYTSPNTLGRYYAMHLLYIPSMHYTQVSWGFGLGLSREWPTQASYIHEFGQEVTKVSQMTVI